MPRAKKRLLKARGDERWDEMGREMSEGLMRAKNIGDCYIRVDSWCGYFGKFSCRQLHM